MSLSSKFRRKSLKKKQLKLEQIRKQENEKIQARITLIELDVEALDRRTKLAADQEKFEECLELKKQSEDLQNKANLLKAQIVEAPEQKDEVKSKNKEKKTPKSAETPDLRTLFSNADSTMQVLKEQVEALVESCNELHQQLKLTPDDFPNDPLVPLIFNGQTNLIGYGIDNIEAVGMHLGKLNAIIRGDDSNKETGSVSQAVMMTSAGRFRRSSGLPSPSNNMGLPIPSNNSDGKIEEEPILGLPPPFQERKQQREAAVARRNVHAGRRLSENAAIARRNVHAGRRLSENAAIVTLGEETDSFDGPVFEPIHRSSHHERRKSIQLEREEEKQAINAQMAMMIRICDETHKKLNLSVEDFSDDQVGLLIFNKKILAMDLGKPGLEAVVLHLHKLNEMLRQQDEDEISVPDIGVRISDLKERAKPEPPAASSLQQAKIPKHLKDSKEILPPHRADVELNYLETDQFNMSMEQKQKIRAEKMEYLFGLKEKSGVTKNLDI